MAGAIWIVFDRQHLSRDIVFGPLEIDQAIEFLVPTAAMLGGDHSMMIPAIGAAPADGEGLLRLELREDGLVVEHAPRAPAGGSRIVKLNWHNHTTLEQIDSR